MIEEQEDGSLSFWHGDHALQATAFPKDHAVQPAEVVENKRLSVALEFSEARQRERVEAKIAKPATTRREARLLRARTRPDGPQRDALRQRHRDGIKSGRPDIAILEKAGHLYFGPSPKVRAGRLWQVPRGPTAGVPDTAPG